MTTKLADTPSCIHPIMGLSSRGAGGRFFQRIPPVTPQSRRFTLLPKRITRSDEHSAFTNSERQLILAAESLRGGQAPARDLKKDEKTGDERISVFWRVFGGTILSICALVVITAYQWLANSIHEVRSDVGRLREGSGEYIKKDEFNTRTTTLWNRVQELQVANASVTVLTAKLNAAEQQITALDVERKETARELQQLRERLAKLEGRDESKPSKAAASTGNNTLPHR
jgi:hypothetical protein